MREEETATDKVTVQVDQSAKSHTHYLVTRGLHVHSKWSQYELAS